MSDGVEGLLGGRRGRAAERRGRVEQGLAFLPGQSVDFSDALFFFSFHRLTLGNCSAWVSIRPSLPDASSGRTWHSSGIGCAEGKEGTRGGEGERGGDGWGSRSNTPSSGPRASSASTSPPLGTPTSRPRAAHTVSAGGRRRRRPTGPAPLSCPRPCCFVSSSLPSRHGRRVIRVSFSPPATVHA